MPGCGSRARARPGRGDLATATPTTVEQRLVGSFAEPTVRNAAERIELWDPTGGVVASDDRDVLGRSFPVAADLRSALDGITVAHNSDLTDPANSDGRGLTPAVEVFVPVRASTQITVDITRWVLRAAAVQAANWRPGHDCLDVRVGEHQRPRSRRPDLRR